MAIFDKTLKEPTRTEQVMVVTQREVIEGVLYHNENVRLSDALNAESQQHSRYICLKDAAVYSVATGRLIFRTCFLLISHQYIIYMTPRSCVVMRDDAAEAPREPADESAGITKVAAEPSPTEKVADEPNEAATPPDEELHPVAIATGTMDHHVAVLGHDHLLSREAMLETIAAIRNGQHGKKRS